MITSGGDARASIVIPAHNEAAVIARTLSSVLSDAQPGEFEIVLVCNGCSDDTAECARNAVPEARVIETATASKTAALNLGIRFASFFPHIYLDADLEVSSKDLRALLRPLERGKAIAATGRMAVDLSGSSYWVRAFYRVWRLNPYFDQGKFGGLFALSEEAVERLGRFPEVTADDEYLRRIFTPEECTYVPACRFVAHAPRRLQDLMKIRRRSRRGTRELEEQELSPPSVSGLRSAIVIFRRASVRPQVWLDLVFYYAISAWVRVAACFTPTTKQNVWERDESSRLSRSRG